MRRTRAEVYLHFVWTTAKRDPILHDDVERGAHHCISDQAGEMGCTVVAMGGMPDHVHVMLRVPAKHAPAKVANQLKGVSSRLISATYSGCEHFAWQEGYGVFSLSRTDLSRVIEYIRCQKEHHRAGKTWETSEQSDDELVGTRADARLIARP